MTQVPVSVDWSNPFSLSLSFEEEKETFNSPHILSIYPSIYVSSDSSGIYKTVH